MSFFYGWTLDQVESLDIDNFDQYWLAITTIEAQNMLNSIDVDCYRHLSNSDREKARLRLSKLAFPDTFKEPKAVDNNRLAKILSGG